MNTTDTIIDENRRDVLKDLPFTRFDSNKDHKALEVIKARFRIQTGLDTEGNPKYKISPQKVAEAIMDSKTHGLYFMQVGKSANRQQPVLYYYDTKRGYYKEGGNKIIGHLAQMYLGDKMTNHYEYEILGYIRRNRYTLHHDSDVTKTDVNLINLKNGVLSLSDIKLNEGMIDLDNVKLEDHGHKYNFTGCIPIEFDRNKKCPNCMKFIDEVCSDKNGNLNKNKKLIIQKLFGYLLYRNYIHQHTIIFTGFGSNGKTTLLNLMESFIGKDNCSHRAIEDLSNDQFAMADLFGKHINSTGEMTSLSRKGLHRIKALTGNDNVTARNIYQPSFNFRNFAKIIIATNNIPKAPDRSLGFYRRFPVIVFENEFKVNDKKTDKRLIEKLTTPEELSGLINWALTGYLLLEKENGFNFELKTNDNEHYWYDLYSQNELFFLNTYATQGSVDDQEVWLHKLKGAYTTWCRHKDIKSIVGINTLSTTVKENYDVNIDRRQLPNSDEKGLQIIQLKFNLRRFLKDIPEGEIIFREKIAEDEELNRLINGEQKELKEG